MVDSMQGRAVLTPLMGTSKSKTATLGAVSSMNGILRYNGKGMAATQAGKQLNCSLSTFCLVEYNTLNILSLNHHQALHY